MRISDWSSDVCSSDLEAGVLLGAKADYVAGHSLGEYTALCAAQSLDLATTARLLKLRGRSMQAAVPVGQGAMAALLGLDYEAANAVAEEAAQGEICRSEEHTSELQSLMRNSYAVF